MEEFTVEQIIEIHDRIIDKYGGTGRMLNTGTLELLVYKLNREKDIFRQAALFLYSIAARHPFFDGNKRTAFATAENVLQEAGYYLNAETDEIVNLMQKIAKYKCSVQKIEKWVKEKATATSEPVS